MKKCILIGVLAALMLFAFTACDTGATTVGYIAGVKAVANGDKVYLPGETVDLADYSFTLLMADGSEASASAADFTYGEGVLVVPASGEFNPSVSYKGGAWKADLDVNVGTIEEVKVDASKVAETTYYVPVNTLTDSDPKYDEYRDDLIDLEGVVITAKYVDENNVKGEKTISVDNKQVSAALKAWSKGEQTVTVTYAGVVSKDTYKVNVEDNLIASVKLALTDTDAKYYVGDKVSTSALKMVATYVNGETKDVIAASTTTYLYRDADQKYTQTSVSIDTKAPGSQTVYAQYVGTNQATTLDPNASFTFTINENKVTGITATASGLTLYAGKDYSSSIATDIASKLTVKNTYETANPSATALTYGTEYSITSNVNFTNSRVNQKVPVTVSAGGYSYTLYFDLVQAPAES